jgi:hypothetical protein
MMALAFRGWLMVSLVSLNSIQIIHQRYASAAVVGFCISWLWWTNSSKHRCETRWAGTVYAMGAAAGTLTGMWIGTHWR